MYAAGWAESIGFFLLTFILLDKYAETDTNGVPFVVSIILGRLLLDAPLRILDYWGSRISLFVTIISVISILLAAAYYRERRNIVLILSAVILILLNTTAHQAWLHYLRIE
jgi:hypothetical protein